MLIDIASGLIGVGVALVAARVTWYSLSRG